MKHSTWTLVAIGASLLQGGLAAEFHVSPNGTAEGDGSRARPWDLKTAVEHPAGVQPGDTIWLHGGTYRGSFKCKLQGAAGKPIVVRQAPGERAVIDLQPDREIGMGFFAYGEWTCYRDFEVTCSNPKRRTELKGPWPEDVQRGSVECRGSHLQFVNLIVHDLGSGVGAWAEGTGGEIYGCLIYHNGWGAPDRGHGHAIYAQNQEGLKVLSDNICFEQFGSGIHVYGSSKASLKGFRVTGNISFWNGCLNRPGEQSTNLIVGGDAPLEDVEVSENMVYGGGMQLGYAWGHRNKELVAKQNYATGLSVYFQERFQFENNTVIGGRPVLRFTLTEEGSLGDYRLAGNTYFNLEPKFHPFVISRGAQGESHMLDTWQALGFDADAQLHEGPPTETRVFVRPNKYEAGRAHVAVYNWGGRAEVDLNLEGVLKEGQQFRIVSARNFFGPAVITGTYRGQPVKLPLAHSVPPVQPVGMPDYELPHIEPEFGAFVILPGASG